jgi:hypothetical protein
MQLADTRQSESERAAYVQWLEYDPRLVEATVEHWFWSLYHFDNVKPFQYADHAKKINCWSEQLNMCTMSVHAVTSHLDVYQFATNMGDPTLRCSAFTNIQKAMNDEDLGFHPFIDLVKKVFDGKSSSFRDSKREVRDLLATHGAQRHVVWSQETDEPFPADYATFSDPSTAYGKWLHAILDDGSLERCSSGRHPEEVQLRFNLLKSSQRDQQATEAPSTPPVQADREQRRGRDSANEAEQVQRRPNVNQNSVRGDSQLPVDQDPEEAEGDDADEEDGEYEDEGEDEGGDDEYDRDDDPDGSSAGQAASGNNGGQESGNGADRASRRDDRAPADRNEPATGSANAAEGTSTCQGKRASG